MSIPFNNLFEGGPLYIDSEEKVEIKFKPVGNIPELPSKINRIRVRMGKAMEDIEHYLRIQLKKNATYTGPIYLYLQECFRPEPEALIFDLFHNYAVDRILEVTYTREPLWG